MAAEVYTGSIFLLFQIINYLINHCSQIGLTNHFEKVQWSLAYLKPGIYGFSPLFKNKILFVFLKIECLSFL